MNLEHQGVPVPGEMVRFFLSAFVFVAFSCASQPRQPASEEEKSASSAITEEASSIEKMDVTYKQLMSSATPEADFLQLMDRMAKIYFRSTALIRQFDKEILESKQPGYDSNGFPNLFRSETYTKIHASEALHVRLRDKFLYLYKRLNDDRSMALKDSKKSPEISAQASRLSRIRGAIHASLIKRSLNENVFAIEEIANGMREIHLASLAKQINFKNGNSSVPAELQLVKSRLVETALRLRMAHAKYKKGLQKKVDRSEIEIQDEQEIDKEAAQIRQDYASMTQEMNSQEAKRIPAEENKILYPSTGTNGNLVGGAFAPQTWVLSFDDGPDSRYTVPIMKNLERYGFHSTFFWLGKNLKSSAGQTMAATGKEKGHSLANHSMNHLDFSKANNQTSAVLQVEIIDAENLMTHVYGYKPNFYRCPYGACTRVMPVRQMLVDRGYIHAFWAVDSLDWKSAANPNGPSDIVNRVKAQMAQVKKGIILFHDIHPQSVVASEAIMKYLKSLESEGARVVDLCQVVDEVNGDPKNTFCTYKK